MLPETLFSATATVMLVPFLDHQNVTGILTVVQETMRYLGTLRASFDSHNGRGGYDPLWKSFQCELALEEFL